MSDSDSSQKRIEENNEDLVLTRGEGRYFGVLDPDITSDSVHPKNVCINCHEAGHMANRCPQQICPMCGECGHSSNTCSNARRCTNCGDLGHTRQDCPVKSSQVGCRRCGSRSHFTDTCPVIWRCYRLKPEEELEKISDGINISVYCYNCGERNHYGDDCPRPRYSRLPFIRSAFCLENLPRHLKDRFSIAASKYSSPQSSSSSSQSRRQEHQPPPWRSRGNSGGPFSKRSTTNIRKQANNPYSRGPSSSYKHTPLPSSASRAWKKFST